MIIESIEVACKDEAHLNKRHEITCKLTEHRIFIGFRGIFQLFGNKNIYIRESSLGYWEPLESTQVL